MKYLAFIIMLSGCAAWHKQFAKPKDKCGRELCQRFAAENLMQALDGEYDPQAEACACYLLDDEGKLIIYHIPMR